LGGFGRRGGGVKPGLGIGRETVLSPGGQRSGHLLKRLASGSRGCGSPNGFRGRYWCVTHLFQEEGGGETYVERGRGTRLERRRSLSEGENRSKLCLPLPGEVQGTVKRGQTRKAAKISNKETQGESILGRISWPAKRAHIIQESIGGRSVKAAEDVGDGGDTRGGGGTEVAASWTS